MTVINDIKNLYKVYQLMEFFITKYDFINLNAKTIFNKNEIWLVKPSSNIYNVIRITIEPIDTIGVNNEKIQDILKKIESTFKIKSDFIDIHISNIKDVKTQYFKTISIDTDFYDGIDVSDAFPGLKNVIHEEKDNENEIAYRLSLINEYFKNKKNIKKNKVKAKYTISPTLIIIAICIANFVFSFILQRKYDAATSHILLGADYKFFTLGLKQYWRLFTYSFCHGSLIHLLCNMFSLYTLGIYFEYKLGTIKYLFVLLFGIIISSLTNGIFTGSENTLIVGMSGGIYALFALYIIDAIKNGALRSPSFIIILAINISINFTQSVAWQAHIGGAVAGILAYYAFSNNSIDYRIIALYVVLVIGMFYKYNSIENIKPLYGATDSKVVEIIDKLGFKENSKKLNYKIYRYYTEKQGD